MGDPDAESGVDEIGKEVRMDASSDRTVEAVKKVVECFTDGFQFSDILTAVRTAAEIAEQFTGLPGDEKKDFVVEVIRKAYREVNPDVPWIPEPFETWVENYILDNLVPSVIELIVDVTKGKVKVNTSPTEPPG